MLLHIATKHGVSYPNKGYASAKPKPSQSSNGGGDLSEAQVYVRLYVSHFRV